MNVAIDSSIQGKVNNEVNRSIEAIVKGKPMVEKLRA